MNLEREAKDVPVEHTSLPFNSQASNPEVLKTPIWNTVTRMFFPCLILVHYNKYVVLILFIKQTFSEKFYSLINEGCYLVFANLLLKLIVGCYIFLLEE